jgi:hypothetical protein
VTDLNKQLVLEHWATLDGTDIDFTVTSFKDTINDPLAAAIEAVNNIVENYPPPYNLLASGGIDSQAMLYAWKKSNHSFNVYSFRYNETYNIHDIQTLPLFCEQEHIPYTIIDFDYFKFLKEEYDSIAHKYQCSSPQISMYIRMASFFDEGTCVYSGNFLDQFGATLSYAVLGLHRFSKTPEGKNTIPYFFLHTPELAYSMNQYSVNHPSTNSTRRPDRAREYLNKLNKYRAAGFPVVAQKTQLNGFEKFKEYYDSSEYMTRDIMTRMKWCKKPSPRNFDWLFRYPYEELFGEPALNFILNKHPYTIK